MEEILNRRCSRCGKCKGIDEFKDDNKLCNTCIDDKREYRRCKREGIERVREKKETKEPAKRDTTTMYNCPLCKYSVKLYKKSQHEKSQTHQRNLEQQKMNEENLAH